MTDLVRRFLRFWRRLTGRKMLRLNVVGSPIPSTGVVLEIYHPNGDVVERVDWAPGATAIVPRGCKVRVCVNTVGSAKPTFTIGAGV